MPVESSHSCPVQSDRKSYASHKIEHELGGMFDVAHGAGLCAVWGSWARYVYKTNPARFAQFPVIISGRRIFAKNKVIAIIMVIILMLEKIFLD